MDSSSPQELAFTIGILAREAGVNIETVRYYQKRGLLRQPQKSLNGVRYYNRDDLTRLRMIRRAKQLQFTLSEIAKLVPLVENGDCRAAKRLARGKMDVIDGQIALLERARGALKTLTTDCAKECGQPCAFFHGLCHHDFGLGAANGPG